MTNWKHYAGSIFLAGLLLQGCGSSEEAVAQTTTVDTAAAASKAIAANTVSTLIDAEDLTAATNTAKLDFASGAAEDATSASDKVKAVIAALVANGTMSQADADYVLANTDLNELYLEAYFYKFAADKSLPANQAPSRASVLDIVLDPIKDGLVSLMDTSVGGVVTSATFDVVLNSEGVTVLMLDMARGSETMTQIMIDALGRDWSLTAKMCPMLQTNQEFGEKFAALAEESDAMGRFFFENVDAPMYGCLTDAMLLSNDDAVHHESVSHSTNAYMGILMERYAADFFIEPDTGAEGSSGYGTTDRFAGLMFDTGANVDYNSTSKMFTNHGDANELINEQFFYSLFKTPGTTDAFVAAMNNVEVADADNNTQNTTLFMDKIFLGANSPTDANPDTTQGYLNIISIGSAMYEGIYGTTDGTGVEYGFGSYSGSMIGFVKLIPADRYLAYGKAFISAGYAYASYNGVNVWGSAKDGAQAIWDQYTGATEDTAIATAPARSGSLGIISSPWIDDTMSLFMAAWDGVSLSNLWDSLFNDESVLDTLKDTGNKAYYTVIGGQIDNTNVAPTTLGTGEVVYGFHGLIELSIQEDMVNSGATDNLATAKVAFELPPYSELTWSFAYTSAKTGVVGYWNNVVDADWLANLSTNELVRTYFYPSADNLYIPSWLMAIDWLTVPANMTAGSYEAIDISFDGGYMDVYFVSTNAALLTDIELANALAPIKGNIEFTQLDMTDDSILAVDENGQTLEGLYVYKIRVVTPADVEAVLAALAGLGNSALNAIGINTDNATQTVATAE